MTRNAQRRYFLPARDAMQNRTTDISRKRTAQTNFETMFQCRSSRQWHSLSIAVNIHCQTPPGVDSNSNHCLKTASFTGDKCITLPRHLTIGTLNNSRALPTENRTVSLLSFIPRFLRHRRSQNPDHVFNVTTHDENDSYSKQHLITHTTLLQLQQPEAPAERRRNQKFVHRVQQKKETADLVRSARRRVVQMIHRVDVRHDGEAQHVVWNR